MVWGEGISCDLYAFMNMTWYWTGNWEGSDWNWTGLSLRYDHDTRLLSLVVSHFTIYHDTLLMAQWIRSTYILRSTCSLTSS